MMLEQLCRHESLSFSQSETLFGKIIRGEVGEIELAALLTAFKTKGETVDEIAGAAAALRNAATSFEKPSYIFADIVGTGGDGFGTVNISTAAALVAAECGLAVAKHGNISVSSKCGAADVLRELGAKLDAAPQTARACLDATRFCFLFAPHYHAGMRHAMPVRKALKTRTIFNLLGPLANPAAPPIHLIGVYDPMLCMPFAQTLRMLECQTALVVHGSGLDEIAVHGPTAAVLLKDNSLSELILHPADLGLETFSIELLRGGDQKSNAQWLGDLLSGKGNAAHEAAVAANAGALLWIAGVASDLREGVRQAIDVIQSGNARMRLQNYVELTNA